MSTDHRALIDTFYRAFAQRDSETMAACYHADAEFEDGAFRLQGSACGDMWRMLCTRGKDLKIEFRDIQVEGDHGSAHWEAWYTFSGTGRQVHNIIDAEFQFKDGKIFRHHDHFDFWGWSRQALGPIGFALGWSPWLRHKVQAQAAKGLAAFQASR